MRVLVGMAMVCCLSFAAVGCGSDSDSAAEREAREERVAEEREERRRARERAEARERRQAELRQARKRAERQRAQEKAREREEERERQEAEEAAESEEAEAEAACHPSYEGACLDPTASDYDCAGGSGDGPLYTGPVAVVGPDEYDLDRDGDGYACE